MYYCFVHASNSNGWNGALLYEDSRRSRKFSEAEVEARCMAIYPNINWLDLHFDPTPTEFQIQEYQLRQSRGMWQRRNIVGSYEDMLVKEFFKELRTHYPQLCFWGKFLRSFSTVQEDITL